MSSARRRRLALLAMTAACAAVLAPSVALGGGAHAAATHTVILHNFRFHPAALTINRGESVKWVWRDEIEHNVTFRRFHSPSQEHGTYTVRFNRAGTFDYRCTFHWEEGMRGKIIVR